MIFTIKVGEINMYVINGKGSLIRLIAGFFVFTSVILGKLQNPNWFYFTGLVGLMLMISSLTGFCPMELILKLFGIEEKAIVKKVNF